MRMQFAKIILADIRILVSVSFPETVRFLGDYTADFDVPDVSVSVTDEDIRLEREKADTDTHIPSDKYLETLALYRKIAVALLDFNVILMHGSSLSFDGVGYLFTAPSGTGKSTHARLWRDRYGSRVTMINDDKPLIRFIGDTPMIYGTPWDGKHRLSTNTSCPLGGIALLKRSADNRISAIDQNDALATVFSQIYRHDTHDAMSKTVALVMRLVSTVPLYSLAVNMSPDAAEVASSAMHSK